MVTDAPAGSPAAAAGLRPGDALLALDGQPLDGAEAEERFAGVKAGGAAVLRVERETARLEVRVARAVPGYLGILPRPAEAGPGVRVDTAVAGGPAAGAGLRRGDVIEAIDGRPVGIDTLDGLLAQLGASREVSLLVRRGGETLTLLLTLGRRPDSR